VEILLVASSYRSIGNKRGGNKDQLKDNQFFVFFVISISINGLKRDCQANSSCRTHKSQGTWSHDSSVHNSPLQIKVA